MAVPANQMVVMTADELRAMFDAALNPLRLELERLRGASQPSGPILPAEAARRLGVTLRDVQRRLKDGRLTAEFVGGIRMVRWPPPSSAG